MDLVLIKYFSKAKGRNDFKSEPCKLSTVDGWLVMVPEGQHLDAEVNSFQLADPVMRNVYRFRDGARFSTVAGALASKAACTLRAS